MFKYEKRKIKTAIWKGRHSTHIFQIQLCIYLLSLSCTTYLYFYRHFPSHVQHKLMGNSTCAALFNTDKKYTTKIKIVGLFVCSTDIYCYLILFNELIIEAPFKWPARWIGIDKNIMNENRLRIKRINTRNIYFWNTISGQSNDLLEWNGEFFLYQ